MCPCIALYYETSFQKAQISINFKGASFSLMEHFLKMSRDLSPGVNFTYLFQAELVNSTVESTALEEINKKNHLEMVFDDSDHGLSRSHSVDTSLLLYFFGKRGDAELGFEDFRKFMDNLQTEVLQMEYNEFAKG